MPAPDDPATFSRPWTAALHLRQDPKLVNNSEEQRTVRRYRRAVADAAAGRDVGVPEGRFLQRAGVGLEVVVDQAVGDVLGLVVIGGNGSQTGAHALSEMGLDVVG